VENPYKILQVDSSAEPEVIEAAYRRLARKYHPDVNPAPDAVARMTRLTEAYTVLRDPIRRAEVDRRLTEWWPRWSPPWQWRPADSTPPSRPSEPPSPPPPPSAARAGGTSSGVEGPWRDRRPCSRHLARPSVGACQVCGTTLCNWCASMVQPAGCAPCVWRRARRAQVRALGAIGGFGLAFGLVLDVTLGLAGAPVGSSLVMAYLVSATALGIAVLAGRLWRSGWQDEPRDAGLGVTFLVWAGLLIGWIGAPVLLAKMASDLARGRRLAAMAGSVLDVPRS
jgi:hypothetical protein